MTPIRFLLHLLLVAIVCGMRASALCAGGNTVIFMQSGFPVADTTVIPEAALIEGFRGARVVNAAQLEDALGSPQTSLLGLPYGSAYPEAAWPSILRHLDRGGNLIVLGGKPFTRAAYGAIVTSQSLLYTGMWDLAVATQKKSLRALAYYDHTAARLLPENRLAQLGRPKLVILPAAQALTNEAWQQLMDYVANGGCLLVSGPVQRDEHWQKTDRLMPLHLQATVGPIDVRQSALTLPESKSALQITYPAAVQQAPIDTMRFTDGASLEVIRHGAGKLIWAAEPLEFSEGYDSAAALYAYALGQAGVEPAYRQLQPLSPGVLAFPTMLKDAILYSFSSEFLQNTEIDLEDTATRARLHFLLPSQRAAMILLNRSNGAVLGSYNMD